MHRLAAVCRKGQLVRHLTLSVPNVQRGQFGAVVEVLRGRHHPAVVAPTELIRPGELPQLTRHRHLARCRVEHPERVVGPERNAPVGGVIQMVADLLLRDGYVAEVFASKRLEHAERVRLGAVDEFLAVGRDGDPSLAQGLNRLAAEFQPAGRIGRGSDGGRKQYGNDCESHGHWSLLWSNGSNCFTAEPCTPEGRSEVIASRDCRTRADLQRGPTLW